jgi:hypothetical protein
MEPIRLVTDYLVVRPCQSPEQPNLIVFIRLLTDFLANYSYILVAFYIYSLH